MRRTAALCVLAAGVATTPALEVRVVDPLGRPVTEAIAVCEEPPGEGVDVDARGIATLPDPCRRVYCDLIDHKPGRAWAVGERSVSCTLIPAARLRIELTGDPCEDCTFEALDSGGRVVGGEAIARFRWDTSPHATLRLLDPGPHRLRIARYPSSASNAPDREPVPEWQCEATIELATPSRFRMTLPWRAPVEITGRVRDSDGQAVAGTTVQAAAIDPVAVTAPPVHDPWRGQTPATGPALPGAPVAWNCRTAGEQAPVTAADGTFRLLVDPRVAARIVAGGDGTARGRAEVVVPAGSTAPVTLTLAGDGNPR